MPNAQGDEVSDDGANAQDIDQSEAPKPDTFRLQIYEKANQYLGEFMQNPKDAKAKSELDNLNKQVKEQNVKDKLPKDLENFLIQVPTFIANFEIAKVTSKLRKRTQRTTKHARIWPKSRHGYPKYWIINIPPRRGADGTGSAAADSSSAATT